jgi:hypothetical protein
MFPLDQQDIDHLAPEGWLRIASLVAMARRLLYLMAPDLTASPAKAGAATPRFRFSEPLGPGPKNTGPRIRFFTEPPRLPKPVRVPPPKTSAPLLARIRALQAVIDQPEADAKRFARWIARRKARGHPRPVAFAFLKIPGINRKRLEPMVKQDLRFFNDAAFHKATAPPG